MAGRKSYRKASEALQERYRLKELYGESLIEKGMGELMHMSDEEIAAYEESIKNDTVVLKSAYKALKKELRKFNKYDVASSAEKASQIYEKYKKHLSDEAKEEYAETLIKNINDALEESDTEEKMNKYQELGSELLSELNGYVSDEEAVRFEILDSFAEDAKQIMAENGGAVSPIEAQTEMTEFYERVNQVLKRSNLTRAELAAYDITDLLEDTTGDSYDTLESLYYSNTFKVRIINKQNYAEMQNPLSWIRSQDDYIDSYISSNFE